MFISMFDAERPTESFHLHLLIVAWKIGTIISIRLTLPHLFPVPLHSDNRGNLSRAFECNFCHYILLHYFFFLPTHIHTRLQLSPMHAWIHSHSSHACLFVFHSICPPPNTGSAGAGKSLTIPVNDKRHRARHTEVHKDARTSCYAVHQI